MSRRYRMILSYDGSGYAGWQIQPGRPTIQECVESALRQISGEPVRVHASGRTDAGVHARAQCVHFDAVPRREPYRIRAGLNALLDPEIRVLSVARAPVGFHARYSVTAKEYRYYLWEGPVCPPFLYRYRTQVAGRLDLDAMRAAAAQLVGQHDFSSFAANPQRVVDDAVRTVTALTLSRRGHELCLRAVGEGFLYKMVRSLAGFLIRVGRGQVPPSAAGEVLAARQRTALVETAPPQGLFLWRVRYR